MVKLVQITRVQTGSVFHDNPILDKIILLIQVDSRSQQAFSDVNNRISGSVQIINIQNKK